MSESQHRRGDAQDRTGVRQTRPSGTRQARPSGANGSRRPSSSGNPKKRRKRRKKRSVNSRIGKVLLIVVIVIAFAVAGAILGTVFGILQSTDMLNTSDVLPDSYTSVIYDADDNEVDKLHGEENREYVKLSAVTSNMQNAVIAIEDQRFYEHNGIDIRGIMRAMKQNIVDSVKAGHIQFTQGASTLTQQVLKNEVLEREKSISRKIKEQYLAVSLENAGKTEIVALDKTGTITGGEPKVTDLYPITPVTEEALLLAAGALEQKSEHPLAKAVLAYAETETIACPDVTDFAALPGNGLSARLDGMEIYGGNAEFIATKASVPAELQAEAARLAAEGKTPLFFGGAGRLMGVIAVADTLKEDSPRAIRELQNMGIRVVMLTGDNQRTADAIGRQAGVDEVIAGVLPDGKEAVIRRLQESGKVAMVGDGINDAPALTRADTGIAIGAGTDVAIDAADVVLMNSRLSDVPAAIRLSRATLRNIHENLFWAFIYNIIGIPLAAGVFIPFGLTLNPMFGAAAMSLSSFCVVSNALRLNLFDLHSTKHDRKPKSAALPAAPVQPAAAENTAEPVSAPVVKEDNAMKKTLHVEGMMCCHCEARVKKALEALPAVDEAVVSHEAGTAIVTLNAEVSDADLKKAVEDQDYKVTGIE